MAKKKPQSQVSKQAPSRKPEVLNEQDIRDRGLLVDVPFESGDPDFQGVRYAEGAGREQWEPPEDFEMGGIRWDEMPPVDPAVTAVFEGSGPEQAKPEESTTPADDGGEEEPQR